MTEFKNYICIDGKKAELTEEQLKALGIELPKASPFERVVNHTTNDFFSYYCIGSTGVVNEIIDHGFCNGNGIDDLRYKTANYCTDKAIMEQRALHETLNRLLWRYSMEHDGDKIDWNDSNAEKYNIYYHYGNKDFGVTYCWKQSQLEVVHFYTRGIAEAAIEEIIKPFMEAHPNFKW